MIRFMATIVLFVSYNINAHAFEYKPYTGFGVGMFGLELKTPSVNQKNIVLGGFAKFGLNFNQYLAAELRLGTTGKGTTSYPAGTAIKTASGITIPSPLAFDFSMQARYFVSYLIKPQYELQDNFRIYGLLGGSSVKVKTAFSVAGIPSTNGITSGYSYGAGAEYELADRLKAGVEWVEYWSDVKVGSTSTARIWGMVASLDYRF